jgi:hypothetical protein
MKEQSCMHFKTENGVPCGIIVDVMKTENGGGSGELCTLVETEYS